MDFDAQAILLTEDNEDDAFILRRALKQAGVKNPVHVATDGEEAIDYLAGAGKFADRRKHPLPFLVLLDLKLPLRNGLEVLEWAQGRPELKAVNIVVLTSSAEPRDLAGTRAFGARFYLVKPPNPQAIVDLLRLLRAEHAGEKNPPRHVTGDLFHEPPASNRRGGRVA